MLHIYCDFVWIGWVVVHTVRCAFTLCVFTKQRIRDTKWIGGDGSSIRWFHFQSLHDNFPNDLCRCGCTSFFRNRSWPPRTAIGEFSNFSANALVCKQLAFHELTCSLKATAWKIHKHYVIYHSRNSYWNTFQEWSISLELPFWCS